MRRHPLLVLEALFALALAAAAIRLLPFASVMRLADRRRGGRRDPAQAALARRAIGAAVRRAPFRCVCFQQGLALHWMLRRRALASVLHYGVRPGDRLQAHVWISIDGEAVLGGEEAAGFACLLSRPEPGRA